MYIIYMARQYCSSENVISFVTKCKSLGTEPGKTKLITEKCMFTNSPDSVRSISHHPRDNTYLLLSFRKLTNDNSQMIKVKRGHGSIPILLLLPANC